MEENERFDFFAMMSRMKYINRWALMRNTITENIAEHSLEVAIIAHCLATVRNTYYYDPPHGRSNVSEEPVNVGRVCLLAMYHDASEIITGDMPTPVKYYAPEIRDAYKKSRAYGFRETSGRVAGRDAGNFSSNYDCAAGG